MKDRIAAWGKATRRRQQLVALLIRNPVQAFKSTNHETILT